MHITVIEIRPAGEFGGHVFEYEPDTDLFKCVNEGCGIYEVVARENARKQGAGEITPCPAASGTTDAPATTAVGGRTPFPADAHTGWSCDAGASLIAEAWHRPGPRRLGTLHGVIYVCPAHQADAERRIAGVDLSPEVHPAPPDHRHDPWPCGHITIYDTEGESLRRDTPPNPPATVEWHQVAESCYVTNHNGQPWTLWAHSVHRGKAGWSGTDEWHLHEGDENASQGSEGRWLCPAGRGGQFHKTKLARAQQLAAWIIANRERADRMTMDVIKNVVLDGKS